LYEKFNNNPNLIDEYEEKEKKQAQKPSVRPAFPTTGSSPRNDVPQKRSPQTTKKPVEDERKPQFTRDTKWQKDLPQKKKIDPELLKKVEK
jgi:hypothetical protein